MSNPKDPKNPGPPVQGRLHAAHDSFEHSRRLVAARMAKIAAQRTTEAAQTSEAHAREATVAEKPSRSEHDGARNRE